jgi:hypothetical protein
MKTPPETIALLESRATRITVQRITVVISRRKKTFAFEGVWAGAAASGISRKLTGPAAVANSQLPGEIFNYFLDIEKESCFGSGGLERRTFMPIDQLGKLLFPRLQPWQRRREMKIIITAGVTGVVFACIVAAIIFLKNSQTR